MIVDIVAKLRGQRSNGDNEYWVSFELPMIEMGNAARLMAFSQQEVFVFARLQDQAMYEIGRGAYNGIVQTPKGDYHVSIRGDGAHLRIADHADKLHGVSFTLRISDVTDVDTARINEKLLDEPEQTVFGARQDNDREDLVQDEYELSTDSI